MDTSTRLPGHGLQYEGRACIPDGEGGFILASTKSNYAGRALCSCGEQSDILPSDAARKRWHRAHKEAVHAGQVTASPAAPDKE